MSKAVAVKIHYGMADGSGRFAEMGGRKSLCPGLDDDRQLAGGRTVFDPRVAKKRA